MARSAECRCGIDWGTCGHCLRNAKPYFFTPSTAQEIIARQIEARPLAAPGLKSYRYRGRYGWIMIGARDRADALREAARSTDAPIDAGALEVWDGARYVPA